MIWVEKEINKDINEKKNEWTCIMLSSSVLTLIKSQSNWKICRNAEIYMLFRKSTFTCKIKQYKWFNSA